MSGTNANGQQLRAVENNAAVRWTGSGSDARPEVDPRLSHDALALKMGAEWSDARYVAAWKRWYFFDKARWVADDRLLSMTRCRNFLRKTSMSAETKKIKQYLRSAPTVAQVISLARSNGDLAATVDQWDADPWLLGTPEGTVDLRSGETQKARREDFITRITAVGPAPTGTRAPQWTKFLTKVTNGDKELIDYLQRAAGLCLTGLTDEDVFQFIHGQGANGKTVYVNTLLGILGDYAATIPTEMLMASPIERHPTELARLRGIRLAIGSETEAGARWAEAKLKRLTGGERIPARFMRGDYFEFKPEFKLVIVGNHLPALASVNEAIKRRLHVVSFGVVIPTEERDPRLEEKLRQEWPAILRWAIDGALEWQARSLEPPPAVRSATSEYLEGQDHIGTWLAECWVDEPEAWASSKALYKSWCGWAKTSGLPGVSKRTLGAKLSDLGYRRRKRRGDRGRAGLRRKVGEIAQPPIWDD